MDNKILQLTGPAYLEQYLKEKSTKLRQTLITQFESIHSHEMKHIKQHFEFLIQRILQDHNAKDLAGRRVNIGRTKPTNEDLEFLEKYFSLSVSSIDEIDIEDETYGVSSISHKEYVIKFAGMDDLYSKIKDLEHQIELLKTK